MARPFQLTVIAFRLLLVVAMFSPASNLRGAAATRTIRVWAHQGQEGESDALRESVRTFNDAHADRGWRVQVAFFPDFQLSERTAIAAAARDLPDAFEIDGPLVARCVAAGLLVPLDRWVSAADRADFIPTILQQGTVDGRLYTLGAYDSAVVLYYDRALLARAGVTAPAEGQGWTWAEFIAACARIKRAGLEPLAMHMNESADEWFTYAFSPVVWSGGGDLISADGRQVRGVLASAANIRSLEAWQALFTQGYAPTDPIDPNPFDREPARVALDWTGHWLARDHLKAKGDNLGAMPLPRIGDAAVAPCGSFCWGVSAQSREPEIAAAWVMWVTNRDQGIVPMVRANGSVPARRSAFAAFPEYTTSPYALFRSQLETIARPRPLTPYYATLTQHFAAALRDISRGAPVGPRLRAAEEEIQKVIDRRLTADAGPVAAKEAR